MAAVLVTSTSRLPNSSILIKAGIVKSCPAASVVASLSQTTADAPQYSMDLSMLESYFQSINKQFYEQKCAVAQNISEQTYRQELVKRQELMTKVDTCLVDVNLLRDFIFNEGHSTVAHADRLQLIRGDIESLKMHFRRLELQSAESLELFSRMKMNEQRVLQVEADMNAMKKNDISEALRVELENLKNLSKEKFEVCDTYQKNQQVLLDKKFFEYDQTLQETLDVKLKTLEEKVKDITDDLDAMVEEAAHEQAGKDPLLSNIFNNHSVPIATHGGSTADPVLVAHSKPEGRESPLVSIARPTQYVRNPEGRESPLVSIARPTQYASDKKIASMESQRNSPIHTNAQSTAQKRDDDNDSDDSDKHDVFNADKDSTQQHADHLKRLAEAHVEHSRLARPTILISSHHPSATGSTSSPSVGTLVDSRRKSSRFMLMRGMSNVGGSMSTEEYKTLLAALAKLQATMQSVQANVHRIHAIRLRNIFTKWFDTNRVQQKAKAFQQIKAYGDRMHQLKVQAIFRRWTKFSNPLQRIFGSYQMKDYLYRWHRTVQRIHTGQRLRIWLQQKIAPWYRRSEPDLSTYVERWKAFIIFSYRVQNIDRPSSSAHGAKRGQHAPPRNFDEDDEAIRMLAVKDFDHSQYLGSNFTIAKLKQMALKELQKKWSIEEAETKESEKWNGLRNMFEKNFQQWQQQLNTSMEAKHAQLSQKLATFEKEISLATKDLRQSLISYEESQKMMVARTEGNYQSLLGELAQLNSQIMVKFSDLKESFDSDQNRLEKYVQQDVIGRIDRMQVDWETKLQDTRNTIQQLQEYNQWKFDTLTTKNKQQDSKLDEHHLKLSSHTELLVANDQLLIKHGEELLQTRKTIKELSLFYDDEVNWLKQVAKESSRTFTEFKGQYTKQLTETNQLLEALMSEEGSEERYAKMMATMSTLLLKADKWYDKAALVSLQYVNAHNKHADSEQKVKSQYEHLFHRVRRELAAQLSKVARRLAEYIAFKSEEEIVMFYVQRYMLQHRHDAFYQNTHYQPTPATAVGAAAMYDTPAKVLSKIDEVRGQFLQQLQQHLQKVFMETTGNDATLRPHTATGVKVSVTTAAGTAVTAAERQQRRQLLITQFLLTVRQCLLAHPAVTSISELESVLKTKSFTPLHNTFTSIPPKMPSTTMTGGMAPTATESHVGGDDSCIAYQHPFPAAVKDSGFHPKVLPVNRPKSPSLSATMNSRFSFVGTASLIPPPSLMTAVSTSNLVAASLTSPKGMKILAHSESVPNCATQNQLNSEAPTLRNLSPSFKLSEKHLGSGSPRARDILKRMDTMKRRSERPFSAPAQYLEAKEIQESTGGFARMRAQLAIDIAPGETPLQQARVFSDFLQRQLHQHMSLSVAAGVSMWLSMMLLMMSMMTHVQEEKALVKYLMYLKEQSDHADQEALQDILDVVRKNRSVPPTPSQAMRTKPAVFHFDGEVPPTASNAMTRPAPLAVDNINLPDMTVDVATTATVSTLAPELGDSFVLLEDDHLPLQLGMNDTDDEDHFEIANLNDEATRRLRAFPSHDMVIHESDFEHDNEQENLTVQLVGDSHSQSLALESRVGGL